jgi:hypothetical protein
MDRFEQQAESVTRMISNYRKVPVKLTDIRKVGNTFYSGTHPVRNTAMNDLLNIFSIKNDLVNEIKNDKDQWEPLQNTLSNIKNDRVVTAITHTAGDMTDVVRFEKSEIEEESPLDLQRGLDMIKTYLENNGENIQLHSMGFNSSTLRIESQFRDILKKIDVFKDGNDVWDTGFNVMFGEQNTEVSPFFLRLVCTNGMTATEMVARRYINTSKLKDSSFTKLINKTVEQDLSHVVGENCNRLKHTNASLREFFAARDILMGFSKDIANDYFDDKQVQEAYKPYKIKYKNSRWLASANTNVNGYDFFNKITHCISHQDLRDTTRMQLNALASTMFFKGPDRAFQAPDPFTVLNS